MSVLIRRRLDRLARVRGLAATLRCPHTLQMRQGATLQLSTPALLGATTLLLTATGLRGTVPPGLGLTIAAVEYSVVAEASATEAGILTVTITPGLAASASAGAAVTLDPYVDHDCRVLRLQRADDEALLGQSTGQRARYSVAAASLALEPRRWHQLVVAGKARQIHQVDPLAPGGVVAAWELSVGEAA